MFESLRRKGPVSCQRWLVPFRGRQGAGAPPAATSRREQRPGPSPSHVPGARQRGVGALFLSTCDGASGALFMYDPTPHQHNRALRITLPSAARKEDRKTLSSLLSSPFLELTHWYGEGPGIRICDFRMETAHSRPSLLPPQGSTREQGLGLAW